MAAVGGTRAKGRPSYTSRARKANTTERDERAGSGRIYDRCYCGGEMRAETQRTRRLGADDDAILWPGEAQHVAGDLLDEIGIRLVRREEVDVALQFGAHGLEAPDLELRQV